MFFTAGKQSKPKNLIRFSQSLVALIAVLSYPLSANQHTVENVTIHYNALSSKLIPAEVASQYGITRSGRTGLVNISVMKDGKSVIANIYGHGKNLAGQLKELAFKEIKEDKAVYYISTFNFRDAEKLQFDLQVQVERAGKLIPLQFKQQLYSD